MLQESSDRCVLPSWLKSALCFAVFFAACLGAFLYYALRAPIFLDENEALERIKRSPLSLDTADDYFYAIDHPALFHWCNRAILRVLKIPIPGVPKIDPTKDYDWNIASGRAAPRRPVMALRVVNAILLAGAMAAFFFAARISLGGCASGFLLAAPFVLSSTLGTYVAGLIKADAYLAFFLALSLLVWLKFHLSLRPDRFAFVVVMGVVAGLSVSSKLNGGLVTLAYGLYLVIASRGIDRIWRPVAFALVVVTTFVAINPVLQRGGTLWPFHVFRDMFALRGGIYRFHEAYLGTMRWDDLIAFLFPYWYLLPLMAILVANARRERWFLPVILWSSFLIVGTALTTRQPFLRYLMPLDFGLFITVMLSALSISKRLHKGEIRLRDLIKG